MRGMAGINKHRLSEPHCTADVCRVNYLRINGRESPLYSRVAKYEVFLGGYSSLKNDYITFYICHVTCKCKKIKTFPLKFYEIFLFRIAWKTPSFNLRNLKGNGNAPNVKKQIIYFWCAKKFQTAPTSPHVFWEGFKKKDPSSSKNNLQQIQLSDTTETSNGTGFYDQMKL